MQLRRATFYETGDGELFVVPDREKEGRLIKRVLYGEAKR